MIKNRPTRSLPLRLLLKVSRTTGCTFGMGSITHVETTEPVVALTFDDGPDARWTPQILGVLAQYQAKGTFFLLGKSVQKHPELVQRLVDEGHQIGNHTWDHPPIPLVSAHERRKQILRSERALNHYGNPVRFFRPPYYYQSMASRFDIFRLGYTVIIGNRAANDWEVRDTKFILDRLISTVSSGDIVLLHDSLCDQSQISRAPMIRALELFLKKRHDLLRFVTISDLIKSGKPKKEIWLSEPDFNRFRTYKHHS